MSRCARGSAVKEKVTAVIGVGGNALIVDDNHED